MQKSGSRPRSTLLLCQQSHAQGILRLPAIQPPRLHPRGSIPLRFTNSGRMSCHRHHQLQVFPVFTAQGRSPCRCFCGASVFTARRRLFVKWAYLRRRLKSPRLREEGRIPDWKGLKQSPLQSPRYPQLAFPHINNLLRNVAPIFKICWTQSRMSHQPRNQELKPHLYPRRLLTLSSGSNPSWTPLRDTSRQPLFLLLG